MSLVSKVNLAATEMCEVRRQTSIEDSRCCHAVPAVRMFALYAAAVEKKPLAVRLLVPSFVGKRLRGAGWTPQFVHQSVCYALSVWAMLLSHVKRPHGAALRSASAATSSTFDTQVLRDLTPF